MASILVPAVPMPPYALLKCLVNSLVISSWTSRSAGLDTFE